MGRFSWVLTCFVFFLLLGAADRVHGQPTALTADAIRLTLDPVCNARSGVVIPTRLRNDSPMTVPLEVSAEEPRSKTAGKVAVAKVSATIGSPAQPVATRSPLAAHDVADVHINLIGTLGPGEWDIEVRNAGSQVGTITVVSPPVGEGVKLDGAAPDAPEPCGRGTLRCWCAPRCYSSRRRSSRRSSRHGARRHWIRSGRYASNRVMRSEPPLDQSGF
jgi:hypothetical protein